MTSYEEYKTELKRLSKFDYLNSISPEEIAMWVLENRLDEFCAEENRYKNWKKAKQLALRQLLLENL